MLNLPRISKPVICLAGLLLFFGSVGSSPSHSADSNRSEEHGSELPYGAYTYEQLPGEIILERDDWVAVKSPDFFGMATIYNKVIRDGKVLYFAAPAIPFIDN